MNDRSSENFESESINIGDYLRQKREAKGFTIKVISQHTRINATLLDKLERNRLDELPSKAYVAGFVRSYSKTLGLSESECLSILDQTYTNLQGAVPSPNHSPVKTTNINISQTDNGKLSVEESDESSKLMIPVVVIGIALILVATAFFTAGNDPQKEKAPQVAQEQSSSSDAISDEDELDTDLDPAITPKSVSAETPLVDSSIESENAAALEKRMAEEKAAMEAEQNRLAQEKAAQEKAAIEEAAREAQEKKLAEEKAAQEKVAKEIEEKRLAQEKAAIEKAAEEKKLAEQKAAQEKAAQEKAAQEKRLAEQKAAQEKAAEEKRLAEQKAAQEKAAEEKRLAEEKAAEEKEEVVATTEKKPLPQEVELKDIPTPMFQYSDASAEDLKEWLPDRYKFALVEGKENVYINATNGETWLTYKSDDNPIKKFILREGRSVLIRGNDVRIFLGNANVAKIFYNNKLINPMSTSGVKSLVFPIENVERLKIPLFIYNKDGSVSASVE